MTSVQSVSHCSRFASISAGSTSKGSLGCGANSAQSSGTVAPGITGKTYIDSGSALCTSSVSIQSTRAAAPSGLSAPSSTPAYSTCRKHVSRSAAVVVLPPLTVKAGEES